jgi:hypothetical protein
LNAIGHFDWQTWSEAFALLAGLFWFLIGVLRMMLARNFASHADHQQLDKRLASLEGRLGPVERGVAVLGEQVQAVKDGVGRTEHMVSIVLTHLLKEDQ